MAQVDISKIKLTDDTLENIKLMAPLLSKDDQNKVFGILLGKLWNIPDAKSKGQSRRRKRQPQKTA